VAAISCQRFMGGGDVPRGARAGAGGQDARTYQNGEAEALEHVRLCGVADVRQVEGVFLVIEGGV
jgi:hypothetical protein